MFVNLYQTKWRNVPEYSSVTCYSRENLRFNTTSSEAPFLFPFVCNYVWNPLIESLRIWRRPSYVSFPVQCLQNSLFLLSFLTFVRSVLAKYLRLWTPHSRFFFLGRILRIHSRFSLKILSSKHKCGINDFTRYNGMSSSKSFQVRSPLEEQGVDTTTALQWHLGK
jgi:hypothetical protein